MEKEKLKELSDQIDKLLEVITKFTDMTNQMRLEMSVPIDYAKACQLIEQGLRYNLVLKSSAKRALVGLIQAKSHHNRHVVSDYVVFNSSESRVGKTVTELGILLLNSVLEAAKEKNEAIAASDVPVEERCLQQIQLENKLNKFLSWFTGTSNNPYDLSIVDWENSANDNRIDVYNIGIEKETVFQGFVRKMEAEIACSSRKDNDSDGCVGAFNNCWSNKEALGYLCKNILGFICYLD